MWIFENSPFGDPNQVKYFYEGRQIEKAKSAWILQTSFVVVVVYQNEWIVEELIDSSNKWNNFRSHWTVIPESPTFQIDVVDIWGEETEFHHVVIDKLEIN